MFSELSERIKELDQLRIIAYQKKLENKSLTEQEKEIINIPSETTHKFFKIEKDGRNIEIPIDLPSLG